MAALSQKKKSTPFFIHYLKLCLLIGILAMLASFLFCDIPLAEYFASISSPPRKIAKVFTDLINPNYNLYFWLLVYFVGYLLLKKERLGKFCLLILVSIVASVSINSILKLIFARIEPKLFLSIHQYGFTFFNYRHPFLSFPSGHAATAGAIFGAWACVYPRLNVQFIIISFVLAFTRVILNAHFLSDIIGGTLIGLIISQWVFLRMEKRK